MASSSGRKTTTSRSKPATRSTKRKPTRRTRKPQPALQFSLRPEHQRELFALALITVALVTLIFFATGVAGGIGQYYVLAVQRAFGGGALVVPFTLGLLGVAILIQERMRDARLTGANVLGTVFVLSAILALLEFPEHYIGLGFRDGNGGGFIGYAVVDLLDAAIGRPAAVLVIIVLGLAGVLLTFNLTLRELALGVGTGVQRFWAMLWSAPRRQPQAAPPAPPAALKRELVPMPILPVTDDDMIPTPIAARPARASLFQRSSDAQRQEQPKPMPELVKTATPQPLAKPERPSAATKPAVINATVQEALDGFDVPAVQRTWPLPSFEMLETPVEGGITDEERRVRARLIEETLASFKVEARVVGVNTGPAVTQFELQPAVGVKVSKITTLERDLALALAAQSIRIEAPIPGKAVVGIEIPNSAISMVTMREVIDSEEFEASRGKLRLPLGKDVSGTPVISDMAKMPHLLVAGSTGSGKSVAVNAFLCGLLLKHSPDDLKMILVDPKMVEMIVYNQIPHLLSPVVTELERVVPTLKWATREMERRYKVFARLGCRNLDTYRQMALRRSDLESMPFILIVIDELADLMMMAPDEVETQICRLAQMARATGIHLIIATQRPSVDVITGLIKANFPSRIAFAVSSQVDSRVIIDTPGADQLLGRGDMLYMAADAAKLVRIQGTYVSDREVESIVGFWRRAKPPETELDVPQPNGTARAAAEVNSEHGQHAAQTTTTDVEPAVQHADEAFAPPAAFLSGDEEDELLPQARDLVQHHQRASASLLQRRLRIGYSKAAQLIDLLEQQGVVGPAEGGRSREVLHGDQTPL